MACLPGTFAMATKGIKAHVKKVYLLLEHHSGKRLSSMKIS
jgi:hypothetical protein